MKDFDNIKKALELFEEAAIKRSDALNLGKSKIANRNYDIMADVISYLKSNDSLHELSLFYTHPNLSVRLVASAYLLPLYEKKSIDTLNEISRMKGIVAFDAEMTVKEWKNGNLKKFYTL